MKEEKDRSCWGCDHAKLGGANLLGECKLYGKEILAKKSTKSDKYLVDLGCKSWVEKVRTF